MEWEVGNPAAGRCHWMFWYSYWEDSSRTCQSGAALNGILHIVNYHAISADVNLNPPCQAPQTHRLLDAHGSSLVWVFLVSMQLLHCHWNAKISSLLTWPQRTQALWAPGVVSCLLYSLPMPGTMVLLAIPALWWVGCSSLPAQYTNSIE